jgi:hypothetical protein
MTGIFTSRTAHVAPQSATLAAEKCQSAADPSVPVCQRHPVSTLWALHTGQFQWPCDTLAIRHVPRCSRPAKTRQPLHRHPRAVVLNRR